MPGLWRRIGIVTALLVAAESVLWFFALPFRHVGELHWLFALGVAVTPAAVYVWWRYHRARRATTSLVWTIGYTWLWYSVFIMLWLTPETLRGYALEPDAVSSARALLAALRELAHAVLTLTVIGVWLWLPFGLLVYGLLRWQFDARPATPSANAPAQTETANH